MLEKPRRNVKSQHGYDIKCLNTLWLLQSLHQCVPAIQAGLMNAGVRCRVSPDSQQPRGRRRLAFPNSHVSQSWRKKKYKQERKVRTWIPPRRFQEVTLFFPPLRTRKLFAGLEANASGQIRVICSR